MLFISTGENAALLATVGAAPVELVSAAVVAAVVPVVAAAPVVFTVVGVVAAATPVTLDPPAVAPLAVARLTSPPVMAGVGCELIDEFTVDCGITAFAGESNWPLATVTPCCTPPGSEGPRITPRKPRWAASVASASTSTRGAAGLLYELDIGGMPSVPYDEPVVLL